MPASAPRRAAVAAIATGLVLLAAAAPAQAAGPHPSDASRPAAALLQRRLDSLVTDLGVPGALATVQDRYGRTESRTAGVGDLATGTPVPRDGAIRAGSNTKTFVAVAVLQLVGERRIDLDREIERYLPGLVRGPGGDGRDITVRQLLQQTSGLPNYSEYLADDIRHYEPGELLALALAHPATSAPDNSKERAWKYSNTNYLLAGMLVERVTGHPLAQELDQRIIQPLGLRHTYFPASGETTIKGRHPRGYYRETADAPFVDVTDIDHSWAWAAGQLVSTPSDIDRFFSALLGGELLEEPELREMRRATSDASVTFGPGAAYGLGLVSRPLSCGGVYWGHGGSIPGYESRVGVTEQGRRAVTVAVNEQRNDAPGRARLDEVVDATLCAGPR
ncbi:serine hydrolase domain-containing protein [Kitasatospora sp. NPDC048722]|uniref:serine hydrolase domain-containing protein n=1 Tax=Kitasatospora sp. NPDC048722 TaxID=3155639 RepID=UPI0033D4ACA5